MTDGSPHQHHHEVHPHHEHATHHDAKHHGHEHHGMGGNVNAMAVSATLHA
jgi:hypothetical protein